MNTNTCSSVIAAIDAPQQRKTISVFPCRHRPAAIGKGAGKETGGEKRTRRKGARARGVLLRGRRRKHSTMAIVSGDDGSERVADGLAEVVKGLGQEKKAVLLDQFGVLHDGREAYPQAIEAVRYLREDCGMRLLILSNSSRRACFLLVICI